MHEPNYLELSNYSYQKIQLVKKITKAAALGHIQSKG